MSVIVSVRNGDFSDIMKKYAETKAEKLMENYPKITSVRATLDLQKFRYKAEFIVRGKNVDVEADYESFDLYESVDKAAEKVEHQLDKHIDKIQDHNSHHRPSHKAETEEEITGE